jgi:transposase
VVWNKPSPALSAKQESTWSLAICVAAKALGKLAKTDRIDAQVLARYGEAVRPEVRVLASEAAQELQALVVRRQQVVEMVSAERNRKSGARSERSKAQIDRHIEWLSEEVNHLDQQIQAQLHQSDTWQQQKAILQLVPRVGLVTASTLIALLPERRIDSPANRCTGGSRSDEL